jgi:hypothetical protein
MVHIFTGSLFFFASSALPVATSIRCPGSFASLGSDFQRDPRHTLEVVSVDKSRRFCENFVKFILSLWHDSCWFWTKI